MFQVYFKCVTRTNSTLFHMVEKHYNYYECDLSCLTNRSSFFINSPLNFKNLKIKVAKLISGSKTVFLFFFLPQERQAHRALPAIKE